jgi:hypothetical protein
MDASSHGETYASTQSGELRSHAENILENFTFIAERESLSSTHDFIVGELMAKLRATSASEEEARLKYHRQVCVDTNNVRIVSCCDC